MAQVHLKRGPARVWSRVATDPALWVGILIGLPLGTLVALPVFGTALDDGISNLIGAVTGAALAIMGAFWLWVLQDRRASRELGGGIVAILIPLESAVGALVVDAAREYEGEMEVGEGQERLDRMEKLPTDCRIAQRRLQRFEPHFGRLDFDGTIAVLNVEDAIEDLLAVAVAEVPADGLSIHKTLMLLTNSAAKIQPQLQVVQQAVSDARRHFEATV